MLSSIANLANTNMGVGMLALPSAMASAGIVGGSCLLLLSASIATFGSHLLSKCVDIVGRPAGLTKVTERALGRFGIVATDFSVVIIGTSCAIGYLIVVGDTLPEIHTWLVGEAEAGEEGESSLSPAVDGGGGGSVLASREFWILAACPIVFPLAFLRRIDSLGFASLLVVGCVGVIVVTVLLFALQPSPLFNPCASTSAAASCRGEVHAAGDTQHTLAALPTCLFAFAAQINVPSIASELHNPTPTRVLLTLVGGTLLVSVPPLSNPRLSSPRLSSPRLSSPRMQIRTSQPAHSN